MEQLFQLLWLVLQHPLMIYPTLKATRSSFTIAKQEFPKTHNKSGKGNAFRHVLWNAMICFECYKWKKKPEKIINWTKAITDKHEQLFPNKEMDRLMDLHNNAVGRWLYKEYRFKSLGELIIHIKSLLNNAKKVGTVDGFKDVGNDILYLENEG